MQECEAASTGPKTELSSTWILLFLPPRLAVTVFITVGSLEPFAGGYALVILFAPYTKLNGMKSLGCLSGELHRQVLEHCYPNTRATCHAEHLKCDK